MVSAIILAAGQSRRMGPQNKLLLPFREKVVISQVVDNVAASEVGEVIVVLGYEAEEVQAALEGRKVCFVHNSRYQEGMTTSIQAGVRAASYTSQGFMICLADLPLIIASEYQLLLQAFKKEVSESRQTILMPRFQGQKGNPVIFSRVYRELILAHPEPNGCKALVDAHAAHIRWVDMPHAHIFQDMDTYTDYKGLIE